MAGFLQFSQHTIVTDRLIIAKGLSGLTGKSALTAAMMLTKECWTLTTKTGIVETLQSKT